MRLIKDVSLLTLESMMLFLKELYSAMKHKMMRGQDKDLLACNIRKRAHHLEKIILQGDLSDSSCDWSLFYRQLKGFLDRWDREFNPDSEDIKWAKRILLEYENQRGGIEGCNQRSIKPPDLKDFEDVLFRRRSHRLFLDKTVEREKIGKIIEAAQQAPSSCNRQALVYLVIDKEELKKRVIPTIPGWKPFTHAPALILVLVDKRDYRFPQERFIPYQDAAASIQNILLMATSLGLGSCWCSYTSYSCVKQENRIRELLNIPGELLICGAVILGYPRQNVCSIPRRNLEEVIFWNKVGNI